MNRDKIKSYKAYLLILLVLVLAFLAGPFIGRGEPSVRLIGWDLMILWCIGLAAVFYQKEAGFPQLIDDTVKSLRRWVIPLAIGAIFGIVDVFVFEGILTHAPYQELPPFLQPFPYSILLYTSGAVHVEILHRLLPLTLVMIIARKFLPASYHNTVFWIFAILTSVWEPLEQLPSGDWWLIIYSFASGFIFNLLQAIIYKKAGWLASLSIRLGHYLIWHILLGMYVQYWVL
jgi:hypothetical protein